MAATIVALPHAARQRAWECAWALHDYGQQADPELRWEHPLVERIIRRHPDTLTWADITVITALHRALFDVRV